ncbi:MAG: hypothetical protein ACRYGK_06590 [Janthinobacterium lividum]
MQPQRTTPVRQAMSHANNPSNFIVYRQPIDQAANACLEKNDVEGLAELVATQKPPKLRIRGYHVAPLAQWLCLSPPVASVALVTSVRELSKMNFSTLANAIQERNFDLNDPIRFQKIREQAKSIAKTRLEDRDPDALRDALAANHRGPDTIRNEGAFCMASALRKNTVLRALDLSANDIADAGAMALLLALQENHHLTKLKLDQNPISAVVVEEINACVQRNAKLPIIEAYLKMVIAATGYLPTDLAQSMAFHMAALPCDADPQKGYYGMLAELGLENH